MSDTGDHSQQTANESGSSMGRGARYAIGATALAAVLGTGAYVVTANLTGDRATSTAEVGAMAPAPATVAGPSSSAVSLTSSEPAQAKPSASASMPPVSEEVRKQIQEARAKMAKDGVKVTRPLPKKEGLPPVVGLTSTTVGSLKKGGIVRMVTARSDLTGQEELAWVAGGVTKHGNAKCSQTFRLHNNPKPQKKPNLLICWRTTAKKSVVAVVVDPKGKPSMAKALKELEAKWRAMG